MVQFLAWLQTYCTLTWKLDSYQLIEAQTKWLPFFQTTFSNAFSWMQITEFRLNFTEVCLQGSNWQYIPALVQINPWLGAGQQKAIIRLCIVFGSVCTSSKQNSHIFRHVNIALTSITLVSQITSYSTRLFVQSVTDRWPMGSPHKKPVTQHPLGQCWYNVGIQPLAQRCANVGPTLVCQCWDDVGTTLGQRWRANVGPIDKSTLAQRLWADVYPT